MVATTVRIIPFLFSTLRLPFIRIPACLEPSFSQRPTFDIAVT
jgi:hypothetical protein